MNALSKINTKLSIPKLYLFSFLFSSSLALACRQYQIAMSLLLYSIIGYLCMSPKKSNRYWEIQFMSPKLQESFIVISGCAYIFLVLLVGYYRTDSYAKFTWNYHPSVFFILQASFFGPLFEEIFFRGYIFEISSLGLNNKKRREYLGVCISSFLFALIHLSNINLTTLLNDFAVFSVAGLVLGLLRWYTRSLLYCIIVHMSFNTTMILI